MADTKRDAAAETPGQRRNQIDDDLNRESLASEDRETEHERVRSSNDRDQELEREGITSRHNRGYDEAARGQHDSGEPIDPDSAEAENDRDDTIDE